MAEQRGNGAAAGQRGGVLAGRVAWVVGGTGNVGRFVVRAMLEEGATVVVPSRSSSKLEALEAAVDPASRSRLVPTEGDMSDEGDGDRLLAEVGDRVGPPDAVVATLGGFVPAPSVLAASLDDLRRALDGYLVAHFAVARALIPVLEQRGGNYTFINGPLAFQPMYPGTGLVSTVTAAQAMLARVVMKEKEGSPVRVNEVVLHTSFGWGDDEARNDGVGQEDVGRYVARLASPRGEGVRGRTIHLDTLDRFEELG